MPGTAADKGAAVNHGRGGAVNSNGAAASAEPVSRAGMARHADGLVVRPSLRKPLSQVRSACATCTGAFLQACGVLFLVGLLEYRVDLRTSVCISGSGVASEPEVAGAESFAASLLGGETAGTAVVARPARARVHRPYVERDEVTGVSVVYDVEDVLERGHSRYQTGEVFTTRFFGNVMLLDSEVMITERDETHYHEMLAHVPLAYFPDATRALIIGGGDGGTLRQVLKHKNIESVTMVEIDEMVVRMSERHFPTMAPGFSDPRTHLLFENGALWLKARLAEMDAGEERHPLGGPFDVILIDSTDFGNAAPLFSSAFYSDIRRLLKPSGVIAFNVDSPSWTLSTVAAVSRQLSALYEHAYIFQVFQPTYSSGHYAFMFASDTVHPYRTPVDWAAYHAKGLRNTYHTPDVHIASFALPAFVSEVVQNRANLTQGEWL